MVIFNRKFSYGIVQEVGEDDVLLTVDGVDYEIPLTNDDRQSVFDAVTEGVYILPVDLERKRLLMTVDTNVEYEVFPELEIMDQLAGATTDNELSDFDIVEEED